MGILPSNIPMLLLENAMTIIVYISRHKSIIKALMLIFTNENNNYPISKLDDSILEISYRTGPKD